MAGRLDREAGLADSTWSDEGDESMCGIEEHRGQLDELGTATDERCRRRWKLDRQCGTGSEWRKHRPQTLNVELADVLRLGQASQHVRPQVHHTAAGR